MKKLILEELEDEELTMEIPSQVSPVELTPDESKNFHVGSLSDILNMYLDNYNALNSYITAPEQYDEGVKQVLQSVLDDTAVIIGKLQGTLNLATGEEQSELINSGIDKVKDIVSKEDIEDKE